MPQCRNPQRPWNSSEPNCWWPTCSTLSKLQSLMRWIMWAVWQTNICLMACSLILLGPWYLRKLIQSFPPIITCPHSLPLSPSLKQYIDTIHPKTHTAIQFFYAYACSWYLVRWLATVPWIPKYFDTSATWLSGTRKWSRWVVPGVQDPTQLDMRGDMEPLRTLAFNFPRFWQSLLI